MPKVSVIIPSYNHEKYVADAIQSVLDQTYQDFEIVITDDGSTDSTVAEIKKIRDPRIRIFTFKNNMGACTAAKKCILESKGEYIAVLSSDDMFLPDKLEKQVKFLNENPDVWGVFGYAQVIDEDGKDFSDEKHFYYNIFKQPNRTRFEWLNYFFYKGNALCHPSALIRRKSYEEVGFYDERLAQIPDFDFWIRLCLKHDVYIIPENLIKFRVRAGEANISGNKPETRIRAYFEYLQVLKNLLSIGSTDDFLRIFPEASKYNNQLEKDLIPYFVALIALENGTIHPLHQHFALDVLYNLLGNEDTAEKLEKKCGFKYIDFIKLSAKYDIFNIEKKEALLAQIAERDRQIAERDRQIAERDRQIAERDRQTQKLLNTYSWRMTSPIRKFSNLLKKMIHFQFI